MIAELWSTAWFAPLACAACAAGALVAAAVLVSRRRAEPGNSSAPKANPSDSVLDMMAEMAQTNQQLQQRLSTAESGLAQQAEEIAAFLDEARSDALTGLPNRRSFDMELARRHSQRRRYNVRYALLLLDIDYFKKFNDVHGHLAGDEVLKSVSGALSACLRDSDLLCRYGGEEFAVLLSIAAEEDIGKAAERFRQSVAVAKCPFEGRELAVSVSVGAAEPRVDEDTVSLIKRADAALYASKEAGRNRGHFHDGERCRPIAGADANAPPVEPSAGHVAANASPSLEEACNDLRKRLIEMVGSGTA